MELTPRSRYIRFRRPRRDIEHAAALVAVARREPAGHQLDPIDGLGVDDADRAFVEVLEMVGLVELEAVEQDECLVVAAAADAEVRGIVVRRQAGEAIHRPEDVIPDLRHRLDVLARHGLARAGALTHEREAARRHRDLLERHGVAREPQLEPGLHPRDDHQLAPEQHVSHARDTERARACRDVLEDESAIVIRVGMQSASHHGHLGPTNRLARLAVDDAPAHGPRGRGRRGQRRGNRRRCGRGWRGHANGVSRCRARGLSRGGRRGQAQQRSQQESASPGSVPGFAEHQGDRPSATWVSVPGRSRASTWPAMSAPRYAGMAVMAGQATSARSHVGRRVDVAASE